MAYMSTSFNPNAHPKKSAGEKFKEDLIFLLIGTFIIYLIQKFFAFLFSPFKAASVNGRGYIEERQEAREQYMDAIEEDETDPMHQFQLRYIINPEAYKGDADNKAYKDWYEAWKRGEVIDSGLRWAPDMYNRDESMRVSFLKYMKIQWNLHRKAGLRDRMRFLRTIRDYYPEFTATLRGVKNDLARYEMMVKEDNLKETLAREINRFGLPEAIAEYLADRNMSPDQLRQAAEFLKPFVEKGYSESTCICALENNLTLEAADAVEQIAVKMELPVRVGIAFLKDEISGDDLVEIHKRMLELREDLGTDVFTVREGEDKMYYDVVLDETLSNIKRRKRAKRYH